VRGPSILYDISSGAILQNHHNSIEALDGVNIGPGRAWVHGISASPRSSFIQNGRVTKRPNMVAQLDKSAIIADGVDVAVISNLPIPTTVTISGPGFLTMEVTDTTAEITADIPGTYTVRCVAFPHLDYEVQIVAT